MKLKDICLLKNGTSVQITSTGRYPIYGSTSIVGFTNDPYLNNDCVAIARVGAQCGFVQYAKAPCTITDNSIICTNIRNINLKYLYYLLSSLNINRLHIGAAQPLITSKIIYDIDIPTHTIAEQCHIVNTISSLFLKSL